MNNDDNEPLIALLCFFLTILMASGVVFPILMMFDASNINKRAVEMEKAYYDSKTGDFKWSDNVSRYIFDGQR